LHYYKVKENPRRVLSLLVRGMGGAGAVAFGSFREACRFVPAFLCLLVVPVLIKDERGGVYLSFVGRRRAVGLQLF